MSSAIYNTNSEIPQDMLLGNLLFVNLADMKIPADELKDIFKNNGIPETYVRDISQADAFRRASSSIRNKSLIMSDGNTVRVEIDEVKSDYDGIKRIIGIKKIDDQAEDVSYQPVGEIFFQRKSGLCVASPYGSMNNHDYNEIYNLCNEVDNKYKDWSVFHNKDTVRNIVNRIVADTHPINLMPTGLCKFTPQSSAQLLYSLKGALDDMGAYVSNSGRENIMEIIPVINTGDQRRLVEKNFKAEVSDELLGIVTELKDILKKKQTISSRSAAAYVEKYKMYQAKIQDYESLLNIYVGSIRAQLSEVLLLIDDDGSQEQEEVSADADV